MKYYIVTDLEGPAGVMFWDDVRVFDSPRKREAMALLTAETNACVEGIMDADPSAEVWVLDGHGYGGLLIADIHPRARTIYGRGLRPGAMGLDSSFAAMLYVGQHAMAGTHDAPLCHTYSSRSIAYYKLNGRKAGEFGCRAAIAGSFGVPTIFLAGDDKACAEARDFVPGIVTVETKVGWGTEIALHLSPVESRRRIREGAATAVYKIPEIKPHVVEPPFELEIQVFEGLALDNYLKLGARRINSNTCVLRKDVITDLPM